MTWYWQYGTQSTRNMSLSNGSEVMYHFLKLLTTHAGTNWTCETSGDGLSAYSASGDVFTSSGSGANGLANTDAWFVLRDPGGRREIMVQRHNNDSQWRLLYSALDKFTGGTPSATVAPTATDEQGWNNGPLTTDQWVFFTGPYITHIGCEDSADGNTYPFWMLSRIQGTGATGGFMMMDAVKDASSPVEDLDKCYLLATRNNLYGNSGAYISHNTASMGVGWQRMNEVDEEYDRLSVMRGYYTGLAMPGLLGTNPNSGDGVRIPGFLGRYTGTLQGPKGELLTMSFKTTSDIYGTLYYDGVNYYVIADEIILGGWPDATLPSI